MDPTAEQTIFNRQKRRQDDHTIPDPPGHGPMGNGMRANSTTRYGVQATRKLLASSAVSNSITNSTMGMGMIASDMPVSSPTHVEQSSEAAKLKAFFENELSKLQQALGILQEELRSKSFDSFEQTKELKQQQMQHATDIADLKRNHSLHASALDQLEQSTALHANDMAHLKQHKQMPSVEQQQQQEDSEDFKKSQPKGDSPNWPANGASGHLEQAPQEKAEEHEEKEREDTIENTLEPSSLMKHSRGYSIEESVWDSAIFIGFECLSRRHWCILLLGLLMTMAIEGSFILIVFVNYRFHSLDEDMLDGLLHWRAVVAHDINNYDSASETSLAARVCSMETSTDKSTFQMLLLQDIEEFRHSPIKELSALNGYYLCNLALVLWFFAIVHDITLNVKFTCSVLAYDFDRASLVEVGEELRIVSLSKVQACLVIFLVTLPRLMIAIFLGYAGTYFLCFTSNLNELLLNAVALVFVLEIDEMLFYSSVPGPAKVLARTIEPLHNPLLDQTNPRRRFIRWVEIVVESLALRWVTVTFLVLLCNWSVLVPFTNKLDLALKYMCSGNKDILFVRNPVNKLNFYANSVEYEVKAAHKMTYGKRAVLEVIDMDPSLFRDKVGILPDAFQYESSSISSDLGGLARKAFGSRYYLSATSMCVDHTDLDILNKVFPGEKAQQFYQSTELFFRDYLNKPDFQSCSELDFRQHCLDSSYSAARALCGRHCGCDNPWSGQFFAKPVVGCPLNCDPRWQLNLYYETPPAIAAYTDRCEDVPMEVLEGEDSWNNYVLGLEAYLLQFEPEEVVKQIDYDLHHKGCGYLTKLRFSADICTPNEIFRSARYYCPATCMCAASDHQECPDSCKYSLPHQKMSPGLSCPNGLQIKSTSECEVAADEILQMVKYIDYNLEDKPAGCYLSHGKLIYATGSHDLEIPYDYVSLCKSSQPFLPNDVSKGKFELGKHCADCILHGMACAHECYFGTAGNGDSGHGHDDSGIGHRILSEEWVLLKNSTKEIGEQGLVPRPAMR